METWYSLLIYVCVFLVGLFGAKWAVSFASADKKDGELVNISLPIGMVLLVSSFLGVSFFLHDTAGNVSFFMYSLLAMGLILMVLFDCRLPVKGYVLSSFVLCFVSTYFFPSLSVGHEILTQILVRLGLTVGWMMLIWVFVQMDKVPFFSMTFSIAFALFYFLMANVSHKVPDIFSVFALLFLSAQVGINWYLKRLQMPVLGRIAGVFAGFVWGGLTIYVVGQGYITQAVLLYAYPMMEVLWSTIVCISLYQRFEPAYPYMVQMALSKNIQPDKVLKSVTKWMCVMACLAYLSVVNVNLSEISFYVAGLILMMNACMRLTSWGQWGAKGPRLRDMFKDLKAGLKQAKDELSKLPLKEVKDQLHTLRQKMPVVPEKMTADTKQDVAVSKKTLSPKNKTHKSAKKSPKTKRGG